MTPTDLKEAIRDKTLEFEAAMKAGKPHSELMSIYKELKELQYRKFQAELQPGQQSQ